MTNSDVVNNLLSKFKGGAHAGTKRLFTYGLYHIFNTLEFWHTALTDEADNNSNTFPAQYTILLRKELKKL
jgi:hypothetical protein